MSGVTVRALGTDEVRDRFEEIVDTYRRAFAGPPNDEDESDVAEFAGRFGPHVDRQGFRFSGAFDGDTALVGFAYGHTGDPSGWWYRTVAPALVRHDRERWLSDFFAVLELAVIPERQGRGLGGRLLDELLAGATGATAVLSTRDVDYAGTRLYRSRGWVHVLRGFRFEPDGPAFTVMGVDLVGRGSV